MTSITCRKQHPTAVLRAAAVRHPVHGVFEGPNHGMAYHAAREAHTSVSCDDFECGFITISGKFVSRDEVSSRLGHKAQSELINQP